MTGSPLRNPVAIMAGFGVLVAALAVNLIGSPALVALAASLLTAAALAPLVAGAETGDWAGRLAARLADSLGGPWPWFRVQSERDGRQRVFAFLAGLNAAVVASFFLRG